MKFNWINLIGAATVVLMLIPNVVYAVKGKGTVRQSRNMLPAILEQTGRYGCMIFMWLPLLAWKFGFHSDAEMFLYIGGNVILLVLYYIYWGFYFKDRKNAAMALAVIPTCIFLLSGILLRHWLLIISAVIFGAGHIYITAKNNP